MKPDAAPRAASPARGRNKGRPRKGEPTTEELIEAFGLDRILELAEDGRFFSEIAEAIGVSRRSLRRWIAADAGRTREFALAMREAAHQVVKAINDEINRIGKDSTPAEVARVRELGIQNRWLAKMLNPDHYGDRQTVVIEDASKLEDDALDREILKLQEAAGLRAPDGSRLQ